MENVQIQDAKVFVDNFHDSQRRTRGINEHSKFEHCHSATWIATGNRASKSRPINAPCHLQTLIIEVNVSSVAQEEG